MRTAVERSHAAHAEAMEARELRHRQTRLTPREREVMQLVAAGLLNNEITDRLGTVEKTVKVYRACVLEKMQARSLAELVRLADRAGRLR